METAINNKEIVIHNILAAMGPILETIQMQALENAIRQNMQGMTLEEECTQLSTWLDDNEHMIGVFLASKKLEGCKDVTLIQYKTTARLFFSVIQKNYRDVTKDDIKIFLARRMRDVKPNTLLNTKRNLSSLFTWLHQEGYIAVNPVSKGGIKVDEIENIHLTPEEEVLVRDVPKTVKEAAVVDFLLSTGVRIGELEAMNRTDIDWNSSTVTFQGEKGIAGSGPYYWMQGRSGTYGITCRRAMTVIRRCSLLIDAIAEHRSGWVRPGWRS